ncbi:hypothetical protein VP193E371_P0125 [Vibrio phage 193E37-1]|nr:hypothetical protein VP193E371_P0125 [Vibrio phage 193E37-1]
MIELKDLTEDETERIKAKVGSSKLYLKALTCHPVFHPLTGKFVIEFGKKYQLEIHNIITCYISALKKGDIGFTYSRDKNTYTNFNKTLTNRKPSSYKRTLELLQLLEDKNYITLYKGFKDVTNSTSMSACCVFTDKFIRCVDPSKVNKFGKTLNETSVEVRDVCGNPIYDLEGYDYMQKKVDSINKWLSKHDFYFGAFPKKIHLQRVYNGDLYTCGRFYFGELQTIRSFKRKAYLINEEDVCELDYSSQHYSILATLAGHALPDNFKPYEVKVDDLLEMKSGYCDKKARQILKLACLMMINPGNPTTSLKNVWENNIHSITKALDSKDFKKAEENPFYGVSGKSNCSEIIKRLKAHNYYAEEFFKRKGGMYGELQFLDSEILFNILLLLKKEDAPCLPYHDSCLVRCRDEEVLRVAMKKSWKKVLGDDYNCRIDKKF